MNTKRPTPQPETKNTVTRETLTPAEMSTLYNSALERIKASGAMVALTFDEYNALKDAKRKLEDVEHRKNELQVRVTRAEDMCERLRRTTHAIIERLSDAPPSEFSEYMRRRMGGPGL